MKISSHLFFLLMCFVLVVNFARPAPLPILEVKEVAAGQAVTTARTPVDIAENAIEKRNLCPCPKEFEKLDCDSGLCSGLIVTNSRANLQLVSTIDYYFKITALIEGYNPLIYEPPKITV